MGVYGLIIQSGFIVVSTKPYFVNEYIRALVRSEKAPIHKPTDFLLAESVRGESDDGFERHVMLYSIA